MTAAVNEDGSIANDPTMPKRFHIKTGDLPDCPMCSSTEHGRTAWGDGTPIVAKPVVAEMSAGGWTVTCFGCHTQVYGLNQAEAVARWTRLAAWPEKDERDSEFARGWNECRKLLVRGRVVPVLSQVFMICDAYESGIGHGLK